MGRPSGSAALATGGDVEDGFTGWRFRRGNAGVARPASTYASEQARGGVLNLTGRAPCQDVRLTDGPHGHRRQPPSREDGELTGGDSGHGEANRWHRRVQRRSALRVEVVTVVGEQWFAGDQEGGGEASGGGWIDHSRLKSKRCKKRNESVESSGSRSRERGGGGGLYPWIDGDPRRRGSSSISSSGVSGHELVVWVDDLEWERASRSKSMARGGL